MSVVNLADRRTLPARRTPQGDVEVRLPGTPWYVIANEDAEAHFVGILQRMRQARGALVAGAAPVPGRAGAILRRPGRCRLQRDGGRHHHGGCRRLVEHEGLCKDAEGDFTPRKARGTYSDPHPTARDRGPFRV